MSKFKAVLSKKIVSVPLIIIGFVLIILIWKALVAGEDSYANKYEGADLSVDIDGIARDDTYAKYLQKFEGVARPDSVIDIDIFNYTSKSEGVSIVNDVDGEDQVVQSEEEGNIEWEVEIPEAGLYSIYLEYYPLESRGINIERDRKSVV